MLKTIPRLILTRGIPGSGKSTWARAMSLKYPNLALVSRDDLRHSLYANYDFGRKELEDFITIQQRALILNALISGRDVIVHDCNVSPQYVSQFKKHFARFADISVVDFSDVDTDTCIERDLTRVDTNAYVGQAIIKRMAKTLGKNTGALMWKKFPMLTPHEGDKLLADTQATKNYSFYIPDITLPDAVIIDIDGTLGILNGRNPFDHTRYHEDAINTPIAKLTKAFSKTLILTGRDDKHAEVTSQWLGKHEIYHESLFMRATGDTRPDYVVKKEIFFEKIAPYYNVQLVVEDRQQVVDMWRELGIVCAQVDVGDF